MAVVNIDIIDSAFAHAPGISWYNIPKYIKWVRGNAERRPVRFFTDRLIGQIDNYPADKNVALLLEPVTWDNTGYDICLKKLAQFDYCLTHDIEFSQKLGGKGLLYPPGGCWLRLEDIRIWPKTKLMSIIASEKRVTRGHQLRHEAIKRFSKNFETFGRGYAPVEFKATALVDYMYSAIIENSSIDCYFTEKLIDCFLTGTVPIYWGTSGIKNYFNMDGIIWIENLEDLAGAIKVAGKDDYESRLPAIYDNFERAMQYRVTEDWIFTKFPFLFA